MLASKVVKTHTKIIRVECKYRINLISHWKMEFLRKPTVNDKLFYKEDRLNQGSQTQILSKMFRRPQIEQKMGIGVEVLIKRL